MEPVNKNQVIADLIADAKQQRDDIAQSVQQLVAIRDTMREALRDVERCVSEAHNSFNDAEFNSWAGMEEPAEGSVAQMIHFALSQNDDVIDNHDV